MRSVAAEFYVVTEEEFPDGLLCIRCMRALELGQPYVSLFTDQDPETGVAYEELCCVYC